KMSSLLLLNVFRDIMVIYIVFYCYFFFFQAEDGIRDFHVTGVQTCALPIVTGEWSQRTAMATFALVPVRRRVVVAKLAAGVAVATLSLGASALVAAVANLTAIATGPDGAGGWALRGAVLGAAAVMQIGNVAMGIAFGMMLLN